MGNGGQKMNEVKTINFDDLDNYECECGNTTSDNGFFPCDEAGNMIEPTAESGWKALYVCADCGAIHTIKAE